MLQALDLTFGKGCFNSCLNPLFALREFMWKKFYLLSV